MGLVHFEKPIKIMLNRQWLFAPLMSIENVVKLWHVVSFPSLFRRFRPKVILPMSRAVGTERGWGQGGNWPPTRFWQYFRYNQNLPFKRPWILLTPTPSDFQPFPRPWCMLAPGTRSNSRPRKTEIYLLYLDKQLYHICTNVTCKYNVGTLYCRYIRTRVVCNL